MEISNSVYELRCMAREIEGDYAAIANTFTLFIRCIWFCLMLDNTMQCNAIRQKTSRNNCYNNSV